MHVHIMWPNDYKTIINYALSVAAQRAGGGGCTWDIRLACTQNHSVLQVFSEIHKISSFLNAKKVRRVSFMNKID